MNDFLACAFPDWAEDVTVTVEGLRKDLPLHSGALAIRGTEHPALVYSRAFHSRFVYVQGKVGETNTCLFLRPWDREATLEFKLFPWGESRTINLCEYFDHLLVSASGIGGPQMKRSTISYRIPATGPVA